MAFSHICSLCRAVTYIVVVILGLSLHDVETSSEKRVIHKKVGDTVELPSSLPTQGVTMAYWNYGGLTVAGKDSAVSKEHQFKGRLEFNTTNFMLTVRKLTLQDSGDFSFISEVNDIQRPTVIITLQVHEPITQQPDLKQINFTHFALTKSCIVLLECSASADSTATYKWTVGNQTRTGPKLEYNFKERDGDTTFTCTVSNYVSEKSASRTIKCSNDTVFPEDKGSSPVSLIIWPFVGVSMIMLLLAPLLFIRRKDLWCNRLRQSETANQGESQQHVYSSLLHGDGSVYETMRGSEDAETGGPPDVYNNVRSS